MSIEFTKAPIMGQSTSFLIMNKGGSVAKYLGLQMSEGFPYKFGRDYTYLEIPIEGFFNETEQRLSKKALRNQHVRIVPACSVEVTGPYKFLVEPNPKLAEHGATSAGYYLNSGDGRRTPHFYLTLKRDLELTDDLDYAIRIYMRG